MKKGEMELKQIEREKKLAFFVIVMKIMTCLFNRVVLKLTHPLFDKIIIVNVLFASYSQFLS